MTEQFDRRTALLAGAGVALAGSAGGAAAQGGLPEQPEMEKALGYLNLAAEALAEADRDKGGHRARAVQMTRDAAAEVRKGILSGAT